VGGGVGRGRVEGVESGGTAGQGREGRGRQSRRGTGWGREGRGGEGRGGEGKGGGGGGAGGRGGNLIEDDKGGLQGGELDEYVDRLREDCPCLGDLLPALGQPRVVGTPTRSVDRL
jgi:hypothetical protein